MWHSPAGFPAGSDRTPGFPLGPLHLRIVMR